MESAEGAAAAQRMADALAGLEETADRWMLLRTAAFLFRRGIDRFRREQQQGVVGRAGHLFATLTRDSFTGFEVTLDDRGTPRLLGQRPDGASVDVKGMSDGARDQLFLALRLAFVAGYAEVAEPLPFLADDIFVQFDDDRTAAGIDALLELAAKTQVLIFTHHRHLAAIARRVGGERVAVIEL
jgi:uncharacterized protein YhaN